MAPLDPPEPSANASPTLPAQVCQVFDSHDLYVSNGVNFNEGLGLPEDACLGDVFTLDPEAAPRRLVLTRGGAAQTVLAGSEIGTPGDAVRPGARFTLMAPDGDQVDVLVLHLGDGAFILPLSPIGTRIDYALVTIGDAPVSGQLADLLCISFARGTMITRGDGSQCAIEALTPGTKVLTRDHGPQPVAWVGQTTLRAVGSFAPVIITQGTLGNSGDLIVSQHHRMFLYQRRRTVTLPTAEVLVQAKHLVDGEKIFVRTGGFVEYFSLVFDRHEIIYAEGIPAESLLVTEATVTRLPPDLAADVAARFPGLSQHQHFGTEAGRQDMAVLRPGKAGR